MDETAPVGELEKELAAEGTLLGTNSDEEDPDGSAGGLLLAPLPLGIITSSEEGEALDDTPDAELVGREVASELLEVALSAGPPMLMPEFAEEVWLADWCEVSCGMTI